MKVYNLIKTLANVCVYNAEGEVFIKLPDGSIVPVKHCEDDWKDGKKILTLVSK